MDRRAREAKRAWLQGGDLEDHARLLRLLIQTGLLEGRRLLCAGFFGHKASRLALPEKIKRYKVIAPTRTLKTENIDHFCRNVFYWPSDIQLRAILGVLRLCWRTVSSDVIRNDLGLILDKLEIYISSKSEEDLEIFMLHTRKIDTWHILYGWKSRNSKYGIIRRNLSAILNSINAVTLNCLRLTNLSSQFEDNMFKKALGSKVIPYLLGEWT